MEGIASKQIDGLYTESALGPSWTGVFLGMIEREVLDIILGLSLCRRYVDGILIFSDQDTLTPFVSTLDSIHLNLSVSREEQKDNGLLLQTFY